MDNWTAEIKSLYDRARRSGNLTYGIWRVEASGSQWKVQDLKGNTVIDGIDSKAIAELVASVPDLCDPDLRPASAPGSIITHEHRSMPLMGIVDVQEVHDRAFKKGFTEGEKQGWEEANR